MWKIQRINQEIDEGENQKLEQKVTELKADEHCRIWCPVVEKAKKCCDVSKKQIGSLIVTGMNVEDGKLTEDTAREKW